jgi:translation initiation factor IF-1
MQSEEKKLRIKVEKIAEKNNGKIISEDYGLATDLVRLQCDKGHEWVAYVGGVAAGGWVCRECVGEKREEEERLKNLRKVEKEREREVLGKAEEAMVSEVVDEVEVTVLERCGEIVWRGSGADMGFIRIRCENGHEWVSSLEGVLKGKWCGRCATRG